MTEVKNNNNENNHDNKEDKNFKQARADPSLSVEDNKDNSDKKEENAPKEPVEYNPRWMGYALVTLSSLLNFSAISSVPGAERREYWIMSMAYGIVTFILSTLILIQDRSQLFVGYFHYTKARDGYFEGYLLLAFVLWWLVGVGYITQPGGIAYVASNIYYSAWVSLFVCVYTLNEWSTEKDILSIAELTGVSTTLRSWYIHFLSGCVVFASSIRLHALLYTFDETQDASFGIALGFVSMTIGIFYISVHYDFFTRCKFEEGGWAELFSSIFLVVVWIIGISVLTHQGAVGATMEGNQCYRDSTRLREDANCTIVLYITDTSGAQSRFQLACEQVPREIPGSNLYFACWSCLLSALNLPFRWKAAQAMNLARAREEQEQRELEGQEVNAASEEDGNDDYDDI